MAKLYFSYAAMNAGKSTLLLQAAYNYRERGMRPRAAFSAKTERDRTQVLPPVPLAHLERGLL